MRKAVALSVHVDPSIDILAAASGGSEPTQGEWELTHDAGIRVVSTSPRPGGVLEQSAPRPVER